MPKIVLIDDKGHKIPFERWAIHFIICYHKELFVFLACIAVLIGVWYDKMYIYPQVLRNCSAYCITEYSVPPEFLEKLRVPIQ